MRIIVFVLVVFLCTYCKHKPTAAVGPDESLDFTEISQDVSLVVLGTVQDGGSPHIGCKKGCCAALWDNPELRRKVVSLGIKDGDKTYIMDASPDFTFQNNYLNERCGHINDKMPDGIFITHAHIGHYTGLMFLGREAKGAKDVPVYAMPRLADFFETNGPWSQLVELNNISLRPLAEQKPVVLSPLLSVTPIAVPHRDEYSETVGFIVNGPLKSILFIPDIDKWNKWEEDIKSWISKVDYAFLDATFYNNAEIPHRDMSEIPHPFVVESMDLFDHLSKEDKAKVHFIHLNHSNDLLNRSSNAYHQVIEKGYEVAELGMTFEL